MKPLTEYALVIKDTNLGTLTDSTGNFNLKVDSLRTIEIISSEGINTWQKINVSKQKVGELQIGELFIWPQGLGLHTYSKSREKLLYRMNSKAKYLEIEKKQWTYNFNYK